MFNMRKSILATAILAGTLGLTACGGSSDSKEKPVEPINTAPHTITVTMTDGEKFFGNVSGLVAGALGATDADSSDTLTFTTEDEHFEIIDNNLVLRDGASIIADTVNVDITVTDSVNSAVTETVTVAVEQLENYYGFNSKYLDNKSSVSYSGQIARQALLNEVKAYVGSLTVENVNAGNITATQVEAHLNALFSDYDAIAENEFTFTDTTNLKQKTFADISASGKSLQGKIAGVDDAKQHKLWQNDGVFIGWSDFGTHAKTPEGLVKHFFAILVSQVEKTNNGETIEDPAGNTISKLFITPEGLDLQQLIQKHMLGAVMFSQGTDDYLEDGLLADNTEQDKGTKAYTSLEHQFDEGFGYFGATRDYLAYTDDEIAQKDGRDDYQGKHDTNGDAVYDLNSEVIFGNSANAAKRDRGATVATDLTSDAMNAFIAGRKIINDAVPNALTDEQMAAVEAQRDIAVLAWEKAIAATVVHYINDVISDDDGDLDDISTGSYSASQFAVFSKHWGEMKGFALNFQFSPFSPVSDENFAKIHELFGEKPVMAQADIEAYKVSLLEARQLIQDAYNFDAENVANW